LTDKPKSIVLIIFFGAILVNNKKTLAKYKEKSEMKLKVEQFKNTIILKMFCFLSINKYNILA